MSSVRVVPILIPVIDYRNLLDAASLLLERSPARQIDAQRIETNTFSGFLQLLRQIENEKAIVDSRITATSTCQLSFGFLIEAPPRVQVQIGTRHKAILASNQKFVIAHSNLNEWFEASVYHCSLIGDIDTRRVYCQIVLLLEQAGVGIVWRNYRRAMIEDGTFILEPL